MKIIDYAEYLYKEENQKNPHCDFWWELGEDKKAPYIKAATDKYISWKERKQNGLL